LVILPHNLLIADYGIGFPRSVHDAYAFQYTRTSREHVELLGDQHCRIPECCEKNHDIIYS
ncbi:hypothetical protein PAXRUDRAFT_766152, partial [Paxillus rubicundulus Ve08.2h10]